MDTEREKRLNEIAGIAVRLESETGLPAQVTIAQWAVESGWGAKPVGQANFFGIKKAARHPRCCVVTTHEVVGGKTITIDAEFADYASLEESCRDYAWLITHGVPYRDAWQEFNRTKDADTLAFEVPRVYATGAYSQLALAISRQSNVAAAIARARGTAVVS